MHHKSASFEPCNPKILHHLRYREDNKDKWLGRPNFMSMTGNMDKGWDKTPFYEKDKSDPYHQKYISVADFARMRDLSKEVGKVDWDGYTRMDNIWGKRAVTSNSLRTYDSI
jgi:hypothetical protein